MVSELEKIRRLKMVNGVFFKPHAIEQAKERSGLDPWEPDKYEKKIVEGEGTYYWDNEYENYQVVFDDVVFPFYLDLHDSRPGLIAFVKSTLPAQNRFRGEDHRFQHLELSKFPYCPRCGQETGDA